MNKLKPFRSWIFLPVLAALLAGMGLACSLPFSPVTPVPSATAPGGGAVSTATVQPPTKPPIPACDIHQLLGSATWQGATGALAGVIRLGNPLSTCKLSGTAQIAIIAKDGQTLKVQSTVQPSDLVLPSQQTAQAMFFWRNYCGPAPASGGLALSLAIPDPTNQVQIPVLDPNHTPLNDTPRCDSQSDPSTFQLDAFSIK